MPDMDSAMDFIGPIWYINAIGNVIGKIGYETVYERAGQQDYSYEGQPTIYRLGYTDAVGNAVGNYTNPLTKVKMFRWGNWDSVNNTIRWNSSEVPLGVSVPSDHTLPASLYLTAKPSWWDSSLNWPQ